MTTAEDIQSILQREANAILNIPISDAFEKAISLIVEQVHRKKGKLVTSGMGKRELKYGGIQGLLLEWYNRILQVI